MTITYNRGLLLAGIESVFNVAETLSAATDAIEVINPDYVPDISAQKRDVVAADLSPFSTITTRKFGSMSFGVELKSNGLTGSATEPRIGRLLRACGMQRTAIDTAAECVFRTVADASNTGDLNFYGDSTLYQGGVYLKIKVEITTGGASGVAVAVFSFPAEAENGGGIAEALMDNTDEVILTDGVEQGIHDANGNLLVTITPDFQSNNPATGDVYWVHVRPDGHLYTPVSNNMASITLEMYFPDETGQAILHRLTGARGTFTINAAVGEIPTIEFEFTGSYIDMGDAAFPTPTYETSLPVGVEYAALAISVLEGQKYVDLCAGQWSVDIANEVSIRDCINGKEAAKGSIITARAPMVTFDPEAVTKATIDLWSRMETDTFQEWWVRHGVTDGNIVLVHTPRMQISNIAYADRNSLRTFQIDGMLSRLSGNDELQILFT